MLAKSLKRAIEKRGGTAEIVERDMRHAVCTTCGEYLTRHNVLNMAGPDYVAWLSDRDNAATCDGTNAHTPSREYELSGELNGYDVHMYVQGDPESGGASHFTVRAISRRGEHDPFSDYNPGGYTFCDRVKDLDWAVR